MKLPEGTKYVLAFLDGIIFSNAIGAFSQGKYLMALLLFASICLTMVFARFVVVTKEWETWD